MELKDLKPSRILCKLGYHKITYTWKLYNKEGHGIDNGFCQRCFQQFWWDEDFETWHKGENGLPYTYRVTYESE